MSDRRTDRSHLVVTGATGLIGHYLLARLLAQGVRCAAVVRDPDADVVRLDALCRPLDACASHAIAREQLVLLRGDLLNDIERPIGLSASDIVHLAGCTRFQLDSNGDPSRTNVQGTQRLLEWASRHDITRVHLASTAYSGGRSSGIVPEAPLPWSAEFNNDYERSKWTCERLCHEWALQDRSRRVTVLRPSIVVGEWATGRTSAFSGLYLAIRAVQAAVSLANRQASSTSLQVPLRLPGKSLGVQNVVPVDYVANMIAAIVSSEAHHGGYYNLVHPAPPENDLIRMGIQAALRIDGLTFSSAPTHRDRRSKFERIFDRVIEPIRPYLFHSPRFSRDRAAAVEFAEGIQCPTYDLSAMTRLCAYAGPSFTAPHETPSLLSAESAKYFEHFLPDQVPKSSVARLIGLTADVRFTLTGIPDGAWLCRFKAGQLTSVLQTKNGEKEDFGYCVGASTFLKIVAGQLDPQQAFLAGQIEVSGNIEQALKMAMVLHQFNTEFPFRSAAAPPPLEDVTRA